MDMTAEHRYLTEQNIPEIIEHVEDFPWDTADLHDVVTYLDAILEMEASKWCAGYTRAIDFDKGALIAEGFRDAARKLRKEGK